MTERASLWQRYLILQALDGTMRQREAAELLGVREAELAAAAPGSRRLKNEWQAVFSAVASWGPICSETRNHAVVLEVDGCHTDVLLSGTVGLMLNPGGLDLRFFIRHWHSAFALERTGADGGYCRSLLFFDEHGDAVYALHLPQETAAAGWQALRCDLADDGNAAPLVQVGAVEAEAATVAGVDVAEFQRDWLALKDVHQFSGLLKKYGMTRRDAFVNAPAGAAARLLPEAGRELLWRVAGAGVPVMLFVGNRGTVQIYSGVLCDVGEEGSLIVVRAPGLAMHLHGERVAETWCVRRPTRDGSITSVELLDAAGATLLTVFGLRREGQPERSDWRALADALPRRGTSDVA